MKTFKESIMPIIAIVLLSCIIIGQCTQRAKHSNEDLYIVTVSENCGTLNIDLIEPTVGNITYQMFLRYYADSLGFVNSDLYFMKVPAEVHKAIRDSSVNVLRCPKKYMDKVTFYRIQPDSIKP